ncbi:hypothetical protein RSWS8N_17954 [Cereibacter sphaeroides WS8N]|uniref:hypothetical protein n=1 Tax=Cereibacter sphaeroides TaxID=1063 RepID=UPI00020B02EB|nr:hypothetical protein [Cereibacter sphaeroides]EGJ20069.1 hypothetical protein RSWS8N_17954 [Cereibacter sphaeroides WS8N]
MPSPRAAFPLQPKARAAALLAAGLIVAACGGGGGGGGPDPVEPGFTGREVKTEGIDSYVTQHNGFTRARIDLASTPADRKALSGFDGGQTPAGYARLIKDAENRFPDKTFVEVIAEVAPLTGGGEKVVKVLRLTADQAPFDNVDSSGNAIGSGKYYFRGTGDFRVYASVDGGAVRTGRGDLENLVIDFDRGTAAINLRTGQEGASEIETQIKADNLTFNVLTGEFGGAITQTARVGGETLSAQGFLRGSISGDETSLRQHDEKMTTSGVYHATGKRLTSQGIFWGSHPNVDK